MPFEYLSRFLVRIHDCLDVGRFGQQHLLMQDKLSDDDGNQTDNRIQNVMTRR